MATNRSGDSVFLIPKPTIENLAFIVGIDGPERGRWTFATRPGPAIPASEGLFRWAVSPPFQETRGIVLCGPPGVGKTGLAVATVMQRAQTLINITASVGHCDSLESATGFALLVAAGVGGVRALRHGLVIRRPTAVWYGDWSSAARRLQSFDRSARMSNGSEFAADLDSLDTLALDDVDSGGITDARESYLRWLVERPERGQRLLLVLNGGPGDFKARVGARIADRLLNPEFYTILELAGESLRGKVAVQS